MEGPVLPARIADLMFATGVEPDVAAALESARSRVDALLFDRRLRAVPPDRIADVRRQAGLASSELEGAGGEIDDSPMGRLVSSCVAVVDECAALAPRAALAPAQAVARLHVVATAWADLPEDDRGRPRTDNEADDPLHLGSVPSAGVAREALSIALTAMQRTDAPALLLAAVSHGQIALGRPFRVGSLPVARGVARIVLSSRGLDPDGLIPVEVGFVAVGRRTYADALRSLRDGDARPWLDVHARAMTHAAGVAESVLFG
jgi:hypothetical protein